jgi:outer membrane protein, heavy metal efflux system
MGRLRRAATLMALLIISGLAACAVPGLPSRESGGGSRSAPPPVELRDVEQLLRGRAHDVPPFEGQDRLQLDILLAEVERRNPSLEAKRRAWNAARARAPQVAALDDPDVSLMIGPRTLDRIGRSRSGGDLDFAYKPEISQKLPYPGKLRLRGEVAEHEADAVRADEFTLREQLLAEAKQAYFEFFITHRALEINARAQDILEDTIANAVARYEAGTSSKQDALQAEIERERLRHRDVMLRRMQRVALARLNSLLNRRPELPLPPPPKAISMPAIPDARESLQELAIRQRPELQVTAARLAAAETRVVLARREFYPDFRVTAAYDAFWQESDLRPMVGFGLNIPLQQSARRAALLQAREEEAAARSELEAQAARVLFEVEVSLQRLTEALHGSEVFEWGLLPAAHENLDAALAGYAAGELDLAAVLIAQRALLDIEFETIELQIDANKSFAELERAVGGSLHDSALHREEHGS